MGLSDRILKGDVLAASRLMRDIDDEVESAVEELKNLYPKTGRAGVIGITGPPGSGKSTLVDKMTGVFRSAGKTVGIIAVDPSSPFSGGAILGDRIRMQHRSTDDGVFIRSLATRGQLGGISRSTYDIIKVMDAMGKDVIFVETVGVGQDEVDVVNAADTSIVVLVPGLGDSIQAMKAGILEIADIFVINKCEMDGADRLEQELNMLLEMRSQQATAWSVPILRTEALAEKGIEELVAKVRRHLEMLHSAGIRRRRQADRIRTEFLNILKSSLINQTVRQLSDSGELDRILEKITQRAIDPYSEVEGILRRLELKECS
jgi:LAO/AO transport system kinase